MENLRALIVDDEQNAVSLLKKLLEDSGHFRRLYVANSVDEGRTVLGEHAVDLVFLDIKMPEQGGFDLIPHLKSLNPSPPFILVTAYDQYMPEAIRQHAFGYLLKPIDRGELNNCLTDFKNNINTGNALIERLEEILEHSVSGSRLRFNTREGFFFVDADEILYCRAEGNYTHIELGPRHHLCSVNLATVEHALPGRNFARIGRSLVVNTRLIAAVDRKRCTLTFEKNNLSFEIKVRKAEIRELDRVQTNR